jgi:MYXO-CTERM domain-containing protein
MARASFQLPRLAGVSALALSVVLGACADETGSAGTASNGASVQLGEQRLALSEQIAPDTLAFDLQIEGRSFRVGLERALAPTTPDYQSYRVREDGSLAPLLAPLPTCSYRGRAEPLLEDGTSGSTEPSGFAAASVCSAETGLPNGQALAGVLRAAGRFWRVTPDRTDTDASDGINHSLLPLHRSDAPVGTPEPAVITAVYRAPESLAPRLEFREGTPEETKFIELVLVNDAARVAQLGAATEATGLRFVDTMNALLEDSGIVPRLRVTLRGQILFDRDPYVPSFNGPEVDHDSLLDAFLGWANDTQLPPHDEHLLLSGLDFLGGTVGYAGLDVACSAQGNGFIVQAADAGGGFAVLSAVHELGHTLGMQHDDGVSCPDSGFIMAAVGCANCPSDNQFSSCSLRDFDTYLSGPAYAAGDRCADDVPGGGTASCGDAVVGAGETCDCGATDCADVDPCCDGSRCQLIAPAECSDFNDGCCQNCAIVSADAQLVCRAQRSSCDIEEVCTGSSKDCPADTFEAAALDCEDERGNSGACYFGECRSRATQCEQIAEQAGFANVAGPGPGCESSCDQVVCGNGPNSCVIINGGPSVADGSLCDGGQCVNQVCVALVDQCPADADKTEPGLCGCGNSEADRDADGSVDCRDECPTDASKRVRGDCGCGVSEADSDTDGSPDCLDECPEDSAKRAAGTCGCGVSETDRDADGSPDCLDECPDDPYSQSAGACGCGVPTSDLDADGTPDCIDACPDDATRTALPCATDASGVAAVRVSASGGCSVGSAPTPGPAAWLALLALPLFYRRRHAQRATP